jgi:hypothetical protein
MSKHKKSKDLGNGVRPPAALGVKYPIWRLGALVSLPYSIGKVMMVKTPDRSLSLRHIASCTAGKTFPSSLLVYESQRSAKLGKASSFPEQTEPKTKGLEETKQVRRREGMAKGRAVKVLLATCPRALLRSTLTARPLAKMRRYEIAL